MLVPLVIIVLVYIGYVWTGISQGSARSTGTLSLMPGLHAPVTVTRDARGIPYIHASSLHDAAFAQGYVTGADRLFEIDITRRFVLGTLSEMLGSATLQA